MIQLAGRPALVFARVVLFESHALIPSFGSSILRIDNHCQYRVTGLSLSFLPGTPLRRLHDGAGYAQASCVRVRENPVEVPVQYRAALCRRNDEPGLQQVGHRAWAYQGDGREEALRGSRIRSRGDASLSGDNGGRLGIQEAVSPLGIVESLLSSKS